MSTSQRPPVKIKQLGLQDYTRLYQQMQAFTDARTPQTPDEIWLVEHPPVFTQGQAGKACHVIDTGDIPLVQTDRGGQVTYHGPGQLIAYTLFDIKRLNIGIRQLVHGLEQAVIDLLASYNLQAHRRDKAPGIYIEQAKIAALGLRVRKYCSYHGLAINVDMDLSPFSRIHPCGDQDLRVVQLRDFVPTIAMASVATNMVECLVKQFNLVETTPSHCGKAL